MNGWKSLLLLLFCLLLLLSPLVRDKLSVTKNDVDTPNW
ncbi:hypothetical protein SynBIOSU31_02052 [Synechococcus sp. BIOS-U3-1]|nr:hypothetical protein SynBIOSU31_02052 [Synechococcus sp. BIOS-U3-1]